MLHEARMFDLSPRPPGTRPLALQDQLFDVQHDLAYPLVVDPESDSKSSYVSIELLDPQ